jgi:hypothetical protein
MRIDQLHPAPTMAQPLEIPVELLASVKRHQGHLAVRVLVDSYADELTAAIRRMMQEERHV